MLDDIHWGSLTDEQKDEVKFKAWAAEQAQKMQQQPTGGWGKPKARPADLPTAKKKQ